MKFSMNAGSLVEAINAGVSSVASRPPLPVLAGVLVEAAERVTFSSFNLERATVRHAAAVVSEPDEAVVSGRLLALVASNLPKTGEAVVSATDSEMVVTAGRTVFRLPLLYRPDYPDIPVMDDGSVIGAVHSEEFAEAVRVVGGYADVNEKTVMGLTVLNLKCEYDGLVLTATDRYIMGRRRVDWEGSDAAAVIHAPAADLLTTIKAVDKNDQVDIEVEDCSLSVSTTNSGTGNVSDAIAATNQYGPGRRLALNSKRLLNALNIVDDKLVTLMFREASHIMSIFPGTIEPNGGPVVPPDTDSSALLIGIRK